MLWGAQFHLPHGRSNALVMESVIQYNADLAGTANNYAAWKYRMMAERLNLPARTPREGTVSLLYAIRKLKREIGIPQGIQATGKVDPELFEKAVEGMAEEAMHDRCTPPIPHRRLRKILSVFIANLSEICVVPSIESLKRSPAVPKKFTKNER